MLELARRRIRGLVRFIDKIKRGIVYTDFEDALGEATDGRTARASASARTGNDSVAKARAYLRDHQDDLALQRLRRNLPVHPR